MLAVAVSTIGRPALADLLRSLADADVRPVSVAVANQSGRPLPFATSGWPFPVTVVDSTGGVSRGRNDAVAALDGAGDVLAFPNDDTTYAPSLPGAVLACFGCATTAAVACRLDDPGGVRLVLPPARTLLSRRTVWRAIEPATFVRRTLFEAVGGFHTHLGVGAASAWGSGEGTDLLLRLMAAGGRIVSRPDLAVDGMGERRHLDDAQLVAKHRSYARGTGYLYRVHSYPPAARLRMLAGPVVRAGTLDDNLPLSLHLALARLLGRVEGLAGRSLARGRGYGRRIEP